MQVKFAAMLVLPLPLYFATLGKTQRGRVIWTAGGASLTNLVAVMVSGATPFSTVGVTTGVARCVQAAIKGLRGMDVRRGPMHNHRGVHGLAVTRS